MLKILIPAVAALGLIAVAAQTQATDAVRADQPEMAWHLSHEEGMAKLAYGVANSDQLALMMTCAPGDRYAAVYGDVQPATPRLIHASYAQPVDGLTDGGFEETHVAVTDATLAGLGRVGRLPVQGEAGRFVLTADRGEQRLARDFLAYCAATRA